MSTHISIVPRDGTLEMQKIHILSRVRDAIREGEDLTGLYEKTQIMRSYESITECKRLELTQQTLQLTNKQQEILTLTPRFRFINRPNINPYFTTKTNEESIPGYKI